MKSRVANFHREHIIMEWINRDFVQDKYEIILDLAKITVNNIQTYRTYQKILETQDEYNWYHELIITKKAVIVENALANVMLEGPNSIAVIPYTETTMYYLISSKCGLEVAPKRLCDSPISILFEVIQLDEDKYRIHSIIRNYSSHYYPFKVGDVIYMNGGIIAFYSKNERGKINNMEVMPTIIVNKEEFSVV